MMKYILECICTVQYVYSTNIILYILCIYIRWVLAETA